MNFCLLEKLSFVEMQGVSFAMERIPYSQIPPSYKVITNSSRHSQRFPPLQGLNSCFLVTIHLSDLWLTSKHLG